MVTTVSLNADIPQSREIRITLPAEVPVGPAEIVLRISAGQSAGSTLGDLAASEFVGVWADRLDIDTAGFAARLRQIAWQRPA